MLRSRRAIARTEPRLPSIRAGASRRAAGPGSSARVRPRSRRSAPTSRSSARRPGCPGRRPPDGRRRPSSDQTLQTDEDQCDDDIRNPRRADETPGVQLHGPDCGRQAGGRTSNLHGGGACPRACRLPLGACPRQRRAARRGRGHDRLRRRPRQAGRGELGMVRRRGRRPLRLLPARRPALASVPRRGGDRNDDLPRDPRLPDRRVHQQLPARTGRRRRHAGLGRLPPGTRTSSITTVVVDRATALACLVFAAWISFAADPEPVAGTLVAALGAATGALVVLLAVAALLVRGGTGLGRRLPPRAQVWLAEARSTVRACARVRVLARTSVLGLAFEALVILALWLVAKAIDLDVSYSVLAVVLPPVLIVSALPISIAGYGVREASFVVLLGHVGIGSTDATLLSLIGGVAFALASLPGGSCSCSAPGRARRARSAGPAPQADDREQERGEEDLRRRRSRAWPRRSPTAPPRAARTPRRSSGRRRRRPAATPAQTTSAPSASPCSSLNRRCAARAGGRGRRAG